MLISSADLTEIRRVTGVEPEILDDNTILSWAEAIENEITQRLNLYFGNYEVTEKYDGNEKPYIYLLRRPVTQVLFLKINDNIEPVFYLYKDDNMILLPQGRIFTKGTQNVEVGYNYGITPEDPKYKLGRQLVLSMLYKKIYLHVGASTTGGIVSEKYVNYSVTFGDYAYAGQIKNLDKEIENLINSLGGTTVFVVT